MSNRRYEIKDILLRNDKTYKWLKDQLIREGYNVDVYYLLSDNSKSFDTEIDSAIKKIFRAEGLIESESERCTRLLNEVVHIDAVVGHSLELLNSTIGDYTSDNILDFDEKKRLTELLDKISGDLNRKLDGAKKIITR